MKHNQNDAVYELIVTTAAGLGILGIGVGLFLMSPALVAIGASLIGVGLLVGPLCRTIAVRLKRPQIPD